MVFIDPMAKRSSTILLFHPVLWKKNRYRFVVATHLHDVVDVKLRGLVEVWAKRVRYKSPTFDDLQGFGVKTWSI